MTYEEILQRALNRVPDSFDKREGSIIYDAIAPCCYELYLTYLDVNEKLNNTFAGTSNREWLIKRGQEIGISPLEATPSERLGIFTPSTKEIDIGERFSFEDLNFIVVEKLEAGKYRLECETLGSVGNYGEGTIIPINYIQGLETATMTDILVYGEDEEDTEVFRQRYFDTLPTMTLDGNIAQYKKWMNEYNGVGGFKIFPLWNGKNTVKVSILSSENTKASQVLIDEVQEYLDPKSEGLGNGKAPIGAIVTVTTADVLNINVDAVVTLKDGYDHIIGLEESINNYLKSVNYNKNTISYVAIASLVYSNECVESALDVNLNGAKSDLILNAEQISALNELNISVV